MRDRRDRRDSSRILAATILREKFLEGEEMVLRFPLDDLKTDFRMPFGETHRAWRGSSSALIDAIYAEAPQGREKVSYSFIRCLSALRLMGESSSSNCVSL